MNPTDDFFSDIKAGDRLEARVHGEVAASGLRRVLHKVARVAATVAVGITIVAGAGVLGSNYFPNTVTDGALANLTLLTEETLLPREEAASRLLDRELLHADDVLTRLDQEREALVAELRERGNTEVCYVVGTYGDKIAPPLGGHADLPGLMAAGVTAAPCAEAAAANEALLTLAGRLSGENRLDEAAQALDQMRYSTTNLEDAQGVATMMNEGNLVTFGCRLDAWRDGRDDKPCFAPSETENKGPLAEGEDAPSIDDEAAADIANEALSRAEAANPKLRLQMMPTTPAPRRSDSGRVVLETVLDRQPQLQASLQVMPQDDAPTP